MRCAAILVMAAATVVAAQRPLEFEVASIKRNPSGEFAGDLRPSPDGSLTATNVPIRYFLGLAWPSADGEHRNLPGWAAGNRYDVIVKPPAGASPAQIREMWRSLLKDRFKVQAHDEMRDTPIYALVLARADGTLGPRLKRSPHTCTSVGRWPLQPTLPSEAELMAGCDSSAVPGRLISGGTLMSSFAQSLGPGLAGRLVEDRTGLTGYYALSLTYTPAPRTTADVPAQPGDVSIFTALQEQLGLKLESVRKPIQTVVIDHIEPPSEN